MNKHTAELLEKYFDTAFAAPEGIKKLRELILTLAMQGKLVPQDPNEQPASELLQEIEAEKQRLVKEGKIKKPKSLPPMREEEKPYALPKGWEWVRLGNIGLINPRNNADDDRLAGFVPMPLIQEGYSEFHSFEELGLAENGFRQAQRHIATAPVGRIDKGIEITPHPVGWIGLEVAPFVMIAETAGGNDCPGRNRTQLGHFGTGQGLVDRRELVVLVFTHGKDVLLILFSVPRDQRASV